jgi:hypothetical protein
MTKKIVFVVAMLVCLTRAGVVRAQAPAPADQPPAAPAAAAPVADSAAGITEKDLQGAVKPTDRANGDPDGALTGTANDIAVADPKVGLTVADVLNQIGANRIGVNFTWTLLCGFLIMFMQAGFAVVEAGLCRAKNANHTMMMNFMVYGVGMLAYFLIGFPLQMGGAGVIANLGGTPVLNSEFTVHLFGKDLGLFGNTGYMLMHHGTYDVAVMVIFLFQMVFMDTTTTIVTGTCCERWKYSAFMVSTMFLGAFTYPIFRELGVGRRVAGHARRQFRSGARIRRFRRLGRRALRRRHYGAGVRPHPRPAHREVHARRQGERHSGARHHVGALRLLHPGVRMVRVQSRINPRHVRQRRPARLPRSRSTRCSRA